jgi:hypothetical protein
MKNIYDVMRQKEMEIERLKQEIEALRVVAPMLEDKESTREMTSGSPPVKNYGNTQPTTDAALTADAGKAARVWP